MNNPQGIIWQKALIVQPPTVHTHLYKKYIYVRADKRPFMAAGYVAEDGRRAPAHLACESFLLSWRGRAMCYPIYSLELFGEFLSRVALVPYAQWSRPHWIGADSEKETAA